VSTEDRSLAVVGMGCRLPGDVDSPAALWRLLVEGRDAVGPLPAERAALVPDAGEANPAGGYLRDVTGFDADFFGVSRREADVLDPQHRLSCTRTSPCHTAPAPSIAGNKDKR
jgi:acyl transferase domain-containing protein